MKLMFLCLAVLAAPLFAAEKKPILIVLTNHSELGNTGKKTGFFLSEAAHPSEVFSKAGHPVTLASPKGGFAPIDPKSMQLDDPANEVFWKNFGNGEGTNPGVARTIALSEVMADGYAGIFFAGGHGSVWDFPNSAILSEKAMAIYNGGGVVGAVCHGPAALVNLKLPDGKPLVAGKKVAVFTNEEEKAVELTEVVPFLLETRFKELGAEVVLAENFSENAVRDGRLVTGQNPASAKKTAELFLEAVK